MRLSPGCGHGLSATHGASADALRLKFCSRRHEDKHVWGADTAVNGRVSRTCCPGLSPEQTSRLARPGLGPSGGQSLLRVSQDRKEGPLSWSQQTRHEQRHVFIHGFSLCRTEGSKPGGSPHHILRAVRQALGEVAVDVQLGQPWGEVGLAQGAAP